MPGSLTPSAGSCRRVCAGLSPASRFQMCMTSRCSLPTQGPNVGPSEACACCAAVWRGLLCSRNTSPDEETPLSSERGTVPRLSRSLGCASSGSCLGNQLVPSPASPRCPLAELGLSSGHGGRAVRMRALTEDEARPQTGASPWAHSPAGAHVCVGATAQASAWLWTSLQLMDFQMKAEILCP